MTAMTSETVNNMSPQEILDFIAEGQMSLGVVVSCVQDWPQMIKFRGLPIAEIDRDPESHLTFLGEHVSWKHIPSRWDVPKRMRVPE
jgi:hypothetical protein